MGRNVKSNSKRHSIIELLIEFVLQKRVITPSWQTFSIAKFETGIHHDQLTSYPRRRLLLDLKPSGRHISVGTAAATTVIDGFVLAYLDKK